MGLLFGDNVKLLTNHHIYSTICDIVAEAKTDLVIVSPYIDMTENMLRDIKRLAETDANVEVIFRTDKLPEYRKTRWLQVLLDAKVNVSTVDLLHSKVYLTENEAILTSMNLINSSKDNSHEIGTVVQASANLYNEIDAYLKELRTHAKPLSDSPQRVLRERVRPARSQKDGSCIVCRKAIKLNPEKPYCTDCWRGEPAGVACHICGSDARTSREKPACYSCYKSGALEK